MEDGSKTAAVGKSARFKNTGDSNNLFDINALIRSVQRADGNPDCFNKSEGMCDHSDCE